MYPPKKKCRKVLIWLSFAVAAQVMFSLLLRGEFNLAPIRRSRTAEITTQRTKARLKLQIKDFDHTKVNYDLISRGKQESLNFMKSGEIKENKRIIVDSPLSGTDIQNPLRGLRRNGFANMSTSLARREDGELKEAVLSDHTAMKNSKEAFEVNRGGKKGANTKELSKVLNKVFISVKTTGAFHESRVTILLHTWFQGAKDQVYFFTDTDDGKMNESLGGHLIKTPCEVGHQRASLCCKMQAELDFFVHNVGAKWFCHFDDDNYVNVPTLVTTLQTFDPSRDLYLGKPSLLREMEAWDSLDGNKEKKFWFATGGAGFCLSRTLVNKMSPYISDGKFVQTCDRIKLPDDCTIGFISEALLLVKLTRSDLFHSHLENLPAVKQQAFSKQISISYGYIGGRYNRVTIDGPFDLLEDPSRFKSFHCLLYPQTSWCPTSEKTPAATLRS